METTDSGKHSNAQTHGIYVYSFLEGEDTEAFNESYEGFIKEWQPVGTTEERTVFDLAWYHWLKRRNEHFHQKEAELIQQYMSERDLENIELIADAVNDAEDEERAIIAINLLPVNYAKWIYQKFPRANYADTRSWIEALKSSAIPKILRIQAGAVRLELSSHKIRIKKATGACKSMEDMIKRDERINSEIDKCIKRLAMIKTLKQVMHVQESQTKAIEQKASSDLA